MGYEIMIQPPKCTITTSGGSSKHKLINYCDRNLAYKMTLPPGSLYTIEPGKETGVCEVGKTVDFVVKRQAGKGPTEDLAIEYYAVAGKSMDPLTGSAALADRTILRLKPTE
ncbi:hypothetical protein Q1695_006716 [Nippostrongylus brasiliensis]|nr:hypothetical protein Q1695_006716 [Nippostrongylus brasiliensis]